MQSVETGLREWIGTTKDGKKVPVNVQIRGSPKKPPGMAVLYAIEERGRGSPSLLKSLQLLICLIQ